MHAGISFEQVRVGEIDKIIENINFVRHDQAVENDIFLIRAEIKQRVTSSQYKLC